MNQSSSSFASRDDGVLCFFTDRKIVFLTKKSLIVSVTPNGSTRARACSVFRRSVLKRQRRTAINLLCHSLPYLILLYLKVTLVQR